MAVQNRLNGNDNHQNTIQLQQQHLYPHPDTVTRFTNRQQQVGHSRAYRHTGNVRSVREIQGNNLILLSLYRVALPKATHAEVNAFLYEIQRIHLTKKRTSTTAYQALEPRNVQWRENYWNMNYPFGIADIDPRKVIDLDEAAGSVDGDQAERYQNHG